MASEIISDFQVKEGGGGRGRGENRRGKAFFFFFFFFFFFKYPKSCTNKFGFGINF